MPGMSRAHKRQTYSSSEQGQGLKETRQRGRRALWATLAAGKAASSGSGFRFCGLRCHVLSTENSPTGVFSCFGNNANRTGPDKKAMAFSPFSVAVTEYPALGNLQRNRFVLADGFGC